MDCLNNFIPPRDLQYIICEYSAPCKMLLHDEIRNFYVIDDCVPLWKIQENLKINRDIEIFDQMQKDWILHQRMKKLENFNV